jgi:hypothetical protein
MEKQNITLAIPKDILLRAKIIAIREGTSVSGLMKTLLEELVERYEGFKAARQDHLSLLDQGLEMGTNGEIGWTRDEVHDR